nr:hypothetical protein L203_03260 [Cryptococcus depauperatus CBS 7841]
MSSLQIGSSDDSHGLTQYGSSHSHLPARKPQCIYLMSRNLCSWDAVGIIYKRTELQIAYTRNGNNKLAGHSMDLFRRFKKHIKGYGTFTMRLSVAGYGMDDKDIPEQTRYDPVPLAANKNGNSRTRMTGAGAALKAYRE